MASSTTPLLNYFRCGRTVSVRPATAFTSASSPSRSGSSLTASQISPCKSTFPRGTRSVLATAMLPHALGTRHGPAQLGLDGHPHHDHEQGAEGYHCRDDDRQGHFQEGRV